MKVKSMRKQDPGLEITHLGFGQSPFPVPAQVQAALREHSSDKDYLPTNGLPRLCTAVANHYHKHYRMHHFPSERVFVGPGSKELLFQLLYLLEGDLLLPAPSWVSYGPQAELLAKPIVRIPTSRENNYKLTPSQLEEAASKANAGQKVLILNSPNNPTGVTYTQPELDALAAVCRDHSVLVLSDEIYAGVQFRHAGPHASIAHAYPEGTIVTGGLSKFVAAGGYRLGVALVPSGDAFSALCHGLRVIISETFSAVSSPIQWAAVKAYEDFEDIVPYLTACTAVHEFASLYLHARFLKMGLECPKPGGAFYLFPSFHKYREPLARRDIKKSVDLANWLLDEAKVATLPASDFYLDPDYLGLRVASVDYDGGPAADHVLAGGRLAGEADIERWAPRLKSGCDRMEAALRGM